ncbi:hypothetical protein Golax_003809 [Gossypium laxum]|uniref:Uncharacterized protein n=1 Tax=Gossypium laxum TaxID=34288 RepID=A0A7J9AGS4_9ROSI|nr:hypothetical protein [Gossypium laxum]
MEFVFISIFLSCKEARKLPSLQPLWEYGVKLTGIPLVFWEEYLISVLVSLRIVNDLFVDGCRVGMIKDVTIGQNIPSQCHEVSIPVEVKAYVCTKKVEEMNRILAVRGIQIPNFTYDFSIPEGLNLLSDTNDDIFTSTARDRDMFPFTIPPLLLSPS